MNKSQRDELKIKVAQHTGYALYHLSNGELATVKQGLVAAQTRLQQLIDDEHDRVERREYENEIMAGDEKSEE